MEKKLALDICKFFKLKNKIYFSKYSKNIMIVTSSSIAMVEILKREYYLGIPALITWVLLIINRKNIFPWKDNT